MRPTSPSRRASTRAQAASLNCAFTRSSSWPSALVDQVATLLASALVKDLHEHPIGELPTSELAS
jgi:hypothetical protein